MQNTGIIGGAPLAVADLSDFDTERAIGVSIYGQFKEPLHPPPPLDRMVEASLLSRKSGHGFYGYEGN